MQIASLCADSNRMCSADEGSNCSACGSIYYDADGGVICNAVSVICSTDGNRNCSEDGRIAEQMSIYLNRHSEFLGYLFEFHLYYVFSYLGMFHIVQC